MTPRSSFLTQSQRKQKTHVQDLKKFFNFTVLRVDPRDDAFKIRKSPDQLAEVSFEGRMVDQILHGILSETLFVERTCSKADTDDTNRSVICFTSRNGMQSHCLNNLLPKVISCSMFGMRTGRKDIPKGVIHLPNSFNSEPSPEPSLFTSTWIQNVIDFPQKQETMKLTSICDNV